MLITVPFDGVGVYHADAKFHAWCSICGLKTSQVRYSGAVWAVSRHLWEQHSVWPNGIWCVKHE